LQAVKANYAEASIKTAWKLLPQSERDRQPPQLQPKAELRKKHTLIELTAQLQQLDDLLETIENDIPTELQTVVDELLMQRESSHEALLEKLDSYCSLIQSRLIGSNQTGLNLA